MHRTQLYIDEEQYRWLKRRAGMHGSIAGVLRDLIDAARARRPKPERDSFIHFLAEEPPADGGVPSTVETLDTDLYG